MADDSFTATSAHGLTYPWGTSVPSGGKLIRIAPSVRWARIPMPGSLGHINSWLLDDEDGFVPVDTGMKIKDCSDEWKAIFTGELAGEKATRVICTHLHPDHIGLAGWLCKRFDVELWMTRGEWLTARMIIGDPRTEVPEAFLTLQKSSGWDQASLDDMAADGWGGFRKVVYEMPMSYRRMKDGDQFSLGKHGWRVVVGSGHSPEHACLINDTDGVMISGDQVLPRISSNVSVVLTEPEADPLGEWFDSIEKLLLLPNDLLICPAHGEPFYGLHARLISLREEHHRRLDAIEAALTDKPMRVVESFPLLFNRKIEGRNRELATGEALAHFHRLEHMGRVTRTVEAGVFWYRRAA